MDIYDQFEPLEKSMFAILTNIGRSCARAPWDARNLVKCISRAPWEARNFAKYMIRASWKAWNRKWCLINECLKTKLLLLVYLEIITLEDLLQLTIDCVPLKGYIR